MTARNHLNSNHLAGLFLGLLAMLGCVRPVLAEDPPLSLTIRAMATEVVVGEPIVLEVTLRNEGEQNLNVSRSLAKHSESASYFISSDHADIRQLGMSMSIPNAPPLVLAPGEALRHIEWLHYDLGPRTQGRPTMVTKGPGIYTIHMQYKTPSSQEGNFWQAKSNSVEVTVTEPEEDWRELVQMLEAPELTASFDQGMPRTFGTIRFEFGWIHEHRLSEQRDEILEQLAASESPYAPYASMLRGGYELAGFDHLDTFEATIAGEEARARRALEHLEAAVTDGFPLRSEAVWYMREATVLLRDEAMAEHLTKRLETEFADTHAAKRPSEIMKYKQGLR